MTEKMYRIVNGVTVEIPEEEVRETEKIFEELFQGIQEELEERMCKIRSLQEKLNLTDDEMRMILNFPFATPEMPVHNEINR